MTAVIDLVTDSLYEIGYLAAAQTPSAGDGALGLRRLNSLIDQWKTEKLMIYQVTRSTWSIVSGTATYTLGSGGAINIARPQYIEAIGYQDSTPDPDAEYALNRLTPDQYISVIQKAQTSTLPTDWYVDTAYPLSVVYLLPIPTSNTLTGVVYHWQAVPVFSALSDTVTLPPAYERMIVMNLAMELCTPFGCQLKPELKLKADQSMAVLKRANFKMEELFANDYGSNSGRYNIRTGP